MKVTILTAGSHGDTRPYVAVGLSLKSLGFDVKIASYEANKDFVEKFNIKFHTLKGSPFPTEPETDRDNLINTDKNFLTFFRKSHSYFSRTLETFLVDCWNSALDSDVILCANLGFAGYHIAEKLGVPCFSLPLQPVHRTMTYPALSLPSSRFLKKQYNLLTHIYAEQLFWQPMRATINKWRKNVLGLRSAPYLGPFRDLNKTGHTVLYGFSDEVFQRPFDWNENIFITGYWDLAGNEIWEPSDKLLSFVKDNNEIVYVGFGSLPIPDSDNIPDIVLNFQNITGKSIILGGKLGQDLNHHFHPNILPVDYVPHTWLFRHVDLVIHHGGAGTVGASLRAGVPSIIIPFFGDQFFWGHLLHSRGLGYLLPLTELTSQKLASLTDRLLSNSESLSKLAQLGERLKMEDGVEQCVHILTKMLQ